MALILDGTKGETLPSWTTATRPASPAVGQMGYNTTIGQFDCYTSGGWVTVLNSGSPQSQLPANIAGNGPAFSAYLPTDQSVTSATVSKIQINTKLFDTASCFNNTGSTVGGIPAYAFLPNVAGYYQVSLTVASSATSATYVAGFIYVNGAGYAREFSAPYSTAGSSSQTVVVYLNGTTDYVEFYAQISGTSPSVLGNTAPYRTLASAALVRAA